MDTVLHRARAVGSGPARAARYVAVGVFGTALYYLSLVLLVEVLKVKVMTATGLSFVLVVAANYVLQRAWTFRSTVSHRRAVAPFVSMSVAGFGINAGVMSFGVGAGIHYLFVQAVAICLVVSWNYFFMTRIFGQPGMPANPNGRTQR